MSKALIGFVLSLACLTLSLPSYEEIDYLIQELEYCIEVHEWYVENNYQREYTGSEEWHLRWIDTYNRTITVLISYRNLLRLLKFRV